MPTFPSAGSPVKITDAFDVRTWTPSWSVSTGSFAAGSGAVNEGWWLQIGRVVHWGFKLQLGSSPTIGGTLLLTLPVEAWVGGGAGLQVGLGSWIYRDNSVPAHWSGTIAGWDAGGTRASFSGAWSGSAPNTRINATQPFAYAVDDTLAGSGVYLSES